MTGADRKRKLISYLGMFKKPVFIMDYEIECLKNSAGELPPSAVRGKSIIAAAGIGNPLNFFHTLLKLSPGRICTAIYPDHFKYRDFDIGEMRTLIEREKPDYVICTEKDYVKLEGRFPGKIPLFYLKINPVLTNSCGEKIGFDALFP